MSMEGVHACQQLNGLGNEAGDGDLEKVEDQPRHQRIEHRGAQQIAGHILGVGAAADHAVAHGPQQDVEDRDVGAGVKQPLCAEERRDEGKTHVGRIGEDRGKPKDGGAAVLAAGRQHQRDDGADADGQHAHPERGQQVAQDLGAELHPIGVDDHGRDNQIDQKVGERLLVFRLEHAGLDGHGARCHQQKEYDDLLCADESQFHTKVLLMDFRINTR